MKAGRELDALVAEKVMGWRIAGFPPGRGMNATQWPYDTAVKGLPNYSTDIAAAWQVVEKLNNGDEIRIIRVDGKWYVGFGHEDFLYNFEEAETAPHAICLAALKAVEVSL